MRVDLRSHRIAVALIGSTIFARSENEKYVCNNSVHDCIDIAMYGW